MNGPTRLEGASDPADMSLVVPLDCPDCGARGVLVLRYGPEASMEEADVLAVLDLHTDVTEQADPKRGTDDGLAGT